MKSFLKDKIFLIFNFLKNFFLFLLLTISFFLFNGCDNSREKNIIKNNKENSKIFFNELELNNLKEVSFEEIRDSGIIIFPNNFDLKAYKEEGFSTCNYKVFLKENKFLELEKIKNFILPIQKLYIQAGWVLNEPVFSEKYLYVTGYKDNKFLSIVFSLNRYDNKKKQHEILIHTALSNI